MQKKAAKPKKEVHSDQVDMLFRINKDFAVKPAGFDSEKWAGKRISKHQSSSGKAERKKLIREADNTIKGMEFPAKEMAQIIRSWMKTDED